MSAVQEDLIMCEFVGFFEGYAVVFLRKERLSAVENNPITETRSHIMEMEYFEPINESSYLSVLRAPVYRKIMRCF